MVGGDTRIPRSGNIGRNRLERGLGGTSLDHRAQPSGRWMDDGVAHMAYPNTPGPVLCRFQYKQEKPGQTVVWMPIAVRGLHHLGRDPAHQPPAAVARPFLCIRRFTQQVGHVGTTVLFQDLVEALITDHRQRVEETGFQCVLDLDLSTL